MAESPAPQSAKPSQSSNAYDVALTPGRTRLVNVIAAVGVLLSIYAAFVTSGPTLWGLLPIVLYAVLCLLGMDIVIGTIIALVSGLIIAKLPPLGIGTLMGESLADQITMIGLIIILGAGVGEVLKLTGVAETIVHGVMRVFGSKSKLAVILGVMLACLILVASLGTLAGALAIAAPILLPITARLGFTRSATASMMFIGGCAGLAMAPFAGSNVAIMDAADVSYLQFVLFGAGPLMILSLVLGLVIVPWMQRRTARQGDFYTEDEIGTESAAPPKGAGRTTAVFLGLLIITVVYATIAAADTTFPLLALPILGIVTGLAGGMSTRNIANAMYRGAASLVSIFLLFWLLAALFQVIDKLAPFEVILELVGDNLASGSPFLFTIVISLLGWVGIPGATAAQVILLDKVFGDLAGTIGISAGSWIVVLLFASKADTYGPFPNGNMIGVMGLARSSNLKNMLITGWLLLVPACVMYLIILFFETR
ncbi:Na+/H+ antiporter NhaC family protein [Saxibacter everestensis]|uniref:Na+/H+ antiporter NhaC family protein n=1 Tax=Saxibacter everestensis TaxID=2909229 RepID=A0ABY8QS00_9MICO|nr:Na+/H+ antiporter NhaC family protein [Brevibacteriaceae bacterium ZFBP1038]